MTAMAQSMLRTSLVMIRHCPSIRISSTESTPNLSRRCIHHDLPTRFLSSSTTTYNQYRYQSSARPLPDDQHEDNSWSDTEELFYPPKRVSLKTASNTFSSINTKLDEKKTDNWEIDYQEFENTETSTIKSSQSTGTKRLNGMSVHPNQHVNEVTIEELSITTTAEVKTSTSPSSLTYTGDTVIPITSTLHLVEPKEDAPRGIWPVFRLMDENGEFRDPSFDGFDGNNVHLSRDVSPSRKSRHDNVDDAATLNSLRSKLCDIFPFQAKEIESSGLLHSAQFPYADTNSSNTLLRAHRQMVRLRTMDSILQNAQRQGRISFYLTCTGEEAIHMGAGSALSDQDPIFAQYREQGLLMWRGFTLEQFTNQCFSNDRDLGKGRQMPIHYGSRALNYHTVSSPLGTQLPQAVGAAYRLKLMKKPNVAVCFFGDGCASTTDFHAALNFAATLSAPVIFFCRNNGYAISTPVTDQYAGDGIVSRAPGYGMAAIRVDGNDVFAVHAAVREAKKYALENNAPVLIEGMTYRLGHHSTSDDSTKYRSEEEVTDFADKMDPLIRLEMFLKRHDLITEDEIISMKELERAAVLEAIKLAEKRPKPNMDSMFEDVYKEIPLHLKKQLEELKQHVAKYPDHY